jgi:kinetochore protein Nuf2
MEANATQSAVIEKENEGMRQVLLEKRSAASALGNKIDVDKRRRQDLQARLESLQQTVSSHEVELQRLRSRIVQSPLRVKQTLVDLSKNVAQMKDEILESEAKGRDHQARITALKKYESELSALIRTVEEWSAELTKANDGSVRLAKLIEERDTKTEDLKEMELRAQQLGRRIKAVTEQRERHAGQADTKKKALQKRMQELQENHEMLMAQRQDVDEESSKRQRAVTMKEKEVGRSSCASCCLIRIARFSNW